MAKKKQRINLIDRNGNSQVVQVNSSDLSDSTKNTKKASVGSTIKNATSGGIAKKFVTVRPSGGTNEQNERNYGALVNASNTNTVTPTIRTSDINANLDKKENQRLANRQYNEALSNTLEARNDLSKKAFNEMKEQGAETDNRNLLSQDKRQLSYETKNKGKTAKDIIEENNEKIAKASENTKEKYQKEIKDLANKENELTYAKYQKDYWDVQNDDIDTVDKTLGIVPNALSDYFSSFTRDQQTYTDENGNELVLPTKSEMKREKTLENIKNPVGRWLYQVGHEGTKQAITQGLNMSGLPLGSALYYGDILTDTYNENLNSGENKTRSIIDAVAKTGQSYIKQKILGGIGGKLTGNNSPSWLEKALSKKFGEFIENPAVTTLLGSATAEGIDEFTDSYIEKALDAAILSDNKEEALKRIKEVFSVDALKEAAYEGSIGMGTGAIGNIDEAIDAAKANRFLKKNGIDIKQARQIAQTQTAEDIQKSAAEGINEVMNQVQQGNITEQQGQQFLDTIQRRTQAILDLQQSMQGNQQNTIESKMEIVQNLNDVEKSKLVEVTQKMKKGQQLDIDDIATLQYLNSKGTPQTAENTPILNETTQPNAISQETQNNTKNREINNNYASQDLEGPPVEEERTPYSKQMTQEEADEMQRAHSESLDRMADGRVGRTPGEQLIKDNNVSDRRVNAIQYDNPEVKKYYRDAAEIVGAEADMARENAFQSGIREQQDELGRTEYRRYAGWNGFISKDLSDLARNGHLTAKQIEKAADDIIEDNGKENNANAKKLEKILDKRLREGYSAFGDNFEPNQDYINEIENIAYEKQRQGELESLEDSNETVKTNETTQNNKQESFNNKAEETFRNIKTKEDMDNLISNLKDKVDNIKTGEDLKNTFKEIYGIYKVYNKSNDIYEIVEKDGLYGTRFESEFYNPDIKYKPLNEEIKIQKDNLESWLKIIKDDSEKIIYDNQDKITPTIGKNIDSIDKVTPITTDDFKNKLHDYIDKETEDIKGKFESKDGHLFRGGKEVRYLYRAIDQAEMDSIKNNGYIKSNQSKNIGYEIEQGLTDFKDGYPGFYLPRNADGYIIKIEVKPENGFFYDSDEYAKTPNKIPANQIVEINGEKINAQRETNQNENIHTTKSENVISEGKKALPHSSKVNEVGYHASNAIFEKYDTNKIGTGQGDNTQGKGINLASVKEAVDGVYGKNTYETKINLENAYTVDDKKLLSTFEKDFGYKTDMENISDELKKKGYDGIIINVNGNKLYTVFDADNLEIVNNKQENIPDKVEKQNNENSLAKRENSAIDKQGNPVMAPFLQNNGGNGDNGGGNNNTTALGKQPEPKKGSVEADILRSYDERIANKKKPFKEKIDTVMHETTRALFDKGEEIYRIGKGHNDAELYPLYDLAQTSKASADFSINADQTNLKGEKVGESLNKVWEEVEKKNLVYEMNKYLYEQHNLDRWNQFNEDGSRKYVFGPEHSDIVSKKNIADLLRLHPELEELSKPILQYQKNLKQLLVDSGLQSQSQSDKLDSIYKNYVPTWRDKDNTGIKAMSNYGGNVTVNNQIKTAKGSSENLLPLKEVQAQMTENIFKAARMNVFLQQLYKDIGDINELKKIGMNSLKSDTNIEPIDADAFYKAAEEHLDEYLKNYAPNNAKVDKVNGQPVATVWFNGHKVTMPIDKGIQTALEPVTVDGSVAKILETINNFKRGVITEYNPIFAITNAKKDVDDAIINSKFSAIEYQAEYAKSIKEMLSNKKMSKEEQTLFNQYLAMGGYSNTVFDKRTGFAKEPKAGGKVLAKIGDMNDFIEQIPRFTEFKLTLKHGGSLTEAMYNAAEVTTNFKRSGVLTKKMDKLATTFFSASMSGFDKQVRNLTQQPSGRAYARFAAKSLAIGLTPAIINGLMYANPFGDDDDKDEAAEAYKNLPQYVKDDYLVWYIGDGKFMRIPKGRVASIPGIVYNAAKNKVQKEEVSFGEMVNSVLNQVGPSNPLSSNAILQIWQSGLFDNKSQGTSWNGSKIESSYLHKKEVTERYDSRTDEISKAISKGVSKATGGKIKISPKKLNYTIDQNSGIIGDILLPIFTPKSTGPSTVSRIFNPITSKFTTDTVVSNKTSNKFYDKIDKYNEKADAETATRADLVKKSYLSSVSGEIADKRKQIEEIESSDLSKNEKYKQTRELQKEINNLQKKALEDENTYKKVGKEVSTIGDEVYYKSSYDGRTTWKKESDKTKAKRDELGLSVEKYYYYKKDEAFKKPDGKTTSIVDGKTAKDKIALVDAFGFDPSDYEKYSYEINQIKAGKDTQRQVTEYIESLPISATQKAALYKKKYKSYRNADRTIYNSIENSNLSKEEKESLAKFLKIK